MKNPPPNNLVKFFKRAGLASAIVLLALLVAWLAARRAQTPAAAGAAPDAPGTPPALAASAATGGGVNDGGGESGEPAAPAETPPAEIPPPEPPANGRPAPAAAAALADAIATARMGGAFALALPGGAAVSGTVNTLTLRPDGTRYVGGRLDGYQRASFFLSVRDGAPAGEILIFDTGRAYVLAPSAENTAGPGSSVFVWQEKPLGDVICHPLMPAPDNENGGGNTAAVARAPSDSSSSGTPLALAARATPVPAYESRPGAPVVLFLDFEGAYIEGSYWNNSGTRAGVPIAAPASTLGDASILALWRRVAEDYAPFNINVTTDRVAYHRAANTRRMRALVSPDNSWYGSAGGVANLTSLGLDSVMRPCWVFNSSLDGAAEAASHELGHTLGLAHDGQTTQTVNSSTNGEYYYGHGVSPMRWGPIMGSSYSRDITQWSKNEYALATNKTQDDLAVIAARVSIGYVNDAIGATRATAASLAFAGAAFQPQAGIITSSTDANYHRFVLAEPRTVTLRATPAVNVANVPDLNIALELQDAAGATLLVTGTGDAVIDNSTLATLSADTGAVALASGTYYVKIAGCGFKDPATDGFSNYASIGRYILAGTLSAPPGAGGPVITAQPSGTALAYNATLNLAVTATGAAPLAYLWHKDNFPLANATRSDGVTLAGATAATLTLAAPVPTDSGAYHVTVTDATGRAVASAAAAVTIAPPPAPVITGQPASIIATSSAAAPGTLAFSVTATGAAPLFYQWFRDGLPVNDSGRFTGANSGTLKITGSTAAEAGHEYSARVFNPGGAATSATVRLLFGDIGGVHWIAAAGAGAEWNDPENWSSLALPTGADTVYINNPVTARVAPGAPAASGTLRVGHGAGERGALTVEAGAALNAAALENGVAGSGIVSVEAGGVITVADAYAQTPASTLALAVVPGGAPALNAGAASLAGALVVAGHAPSGTLIHTAAGITGSFATSNLASADYVSGSAWISGPDLVFTQTLAWTRADAAAHGNFTLAAGETFAPGIPLADNTAHANPAWDGKTLSKLGEGALVLSAGNTYTGTTRVSAGSLTVTGTLGGAAGAPVAISAGATVRLGGDARFTGALATGGTLDFASPAAGPYRVLAVASLAATGDTSVIRLKFNPVTGAGDKLVVLGAASGTHKLEFAFASEPPAAIPSALPVITVAGANTAVFTGTLTLGGIPYVPQLRPDGSVIFVRGALSFIFTGTGAAAWDAPGNWDRDPLLPGGNDTVRIDNSGTAVLAGATAGAANILYLGYPSSAPGSLLAKDNARLDINGSAYVGYYAQGRLALTGTAVVSNTNTAVTTIGFGGASGTGVGAVTLDDCALLETGTGAFYIGYNGTGTLALSGSSTVRSSYATYIGGGSNGTGHVTLDGSSVFETGTYLYIGGYSTGTLALSGSATLRNKGLVGIARLAGSSGHAVLSGAARWETGTSNFHIGYNGAGTLALSGSATVLSGPASGSSSLFASIGRNDGATGVATLADDSVWDAHTSLYVGGSGVTAAAGAGTLEIAGRARVAVTLNYNQTARGTLVIHPAPAARATPYITAKTGSLGGALEVAAVGTGTILHTTGGTISGSFASVSFGGAAAVDYLVPVVALNPAKTDLVLSQTLAWSLASAAAHGNFTIASGETYGLSAPLADNTAETNPAWDGRSLTKLGPGTLVLAAGNTHTGTTRVNAGSLTVTGTLGGSAGGPVVIAANATLALAGGTAARFTGALENNGLLDFASAAAGPYRALTVASLAGAGAARMSRNPVTGAGDRLIVQGAATGGLALDLTLAGAPAPGDPPPNINALRDLVTVAGANTATITGTAAHGDRSYALRQNSSGNIVLAGGSVVVTFDAAGGSVAPLEKIVVPGGSYGALPVPGRDGHDFAGWFTDAGDGVEITATTAVPSDADDHVLHAHWNALPPALNVTPAARSAGEGAGSAAFTVQNTGAGTLAYTAAVTAGGDWAAITNGAAGSLGAGAEAAVTVSYLTNPAGSAARAATLVFTASGAIGSPRTATLTQAANTAAPALAVDKTILSLAQPVGSTGTFAVTSNIAWQAGVAPIGAGGDAGWLDVSPRTGAAGAQVTGTALALAANNTGAPRTAAINIAGAGLERAIIVTQRAAGAATAAPAALATGAVLSFDLGTSGRSETYNVAAGNKLAPTGAGGVLVSYEYIAVGDTATLIFDDAVWTLNFATRRYRLHAADERTGQPYELEGAFAYTVVVTFNAGAAGVTVAPASKPVSPGRPYDELPTLERAGYTFDGWFTAASGGSKITAATIVPVNAGPHSLHARWTAIGGGGENSNSGGGGGGGGGAPALPVLALLAVLLVWRARKK